MRVETLILSITLASGHAASASAAFVDVEAELVDFDPSITTYRIYAIFDSPTDQLLAVSADPDHASIVFASNQPLLNQSDPFPPGIDSDFASFPITTWDSWITIGADGFVGNDTTYTDGFLGSDGFNAVIVGSSWNQRDDGRWFDENPDTPELAGDAGRILIAQFSFDATLSAAFTLQGTAEWLPNAGDVQSDPFFIAVPAPATWMVVSMVLGWSRRRR